MKTIAGVDEVGRGSLIGPVYAAAVILNKSINKKLLKDSKSLRKNKREFLAEYIKKIPEGASKTSKEMRLDLAKEMDADNSCPVSTGIFLRKAIEEHGKEIPFWRLIDENHPVVKKLNLDPQEIKYMRNLEGID